MNKDLDAFENRSDDWLATERKREDLVSAWDLDEGHKLKEEHRENCEAYEIKKNHEIKHEYYNLINLKKNNVNNQFQWYKVFRAIKVLLFTVVWLIIFRGTGLTIPIIIIILLANLLPSKRRK